jgi:hypothetical protein
MSDNLLLDILDGSSTMAPELLDAGSSMLRGIAQPMSDGFSWGSEALDKIGNMPYQITTPESYAKPSSFMSELSATLQPYNDFLKSNKEVMGVGVGGLGALVSYMDAKKRNALNKKALAQQQAEIAKRRAEAMKYNDPVSYQQNRMQVANPMSNPGGETSFFDTNSLAGLTKMAEGGSTNDKLRAIEQLMAERAAQYGRGTDRQSTPAEQRLFDSVPDERFYDFLRNMPRSEVNVDTHAQDAKDRASLLRRLGFASGGYISGDLAQAGPALQMMARLRQAAGPNAVRAANDQKAQRRATGGYMDGGTPGQSDQIPAMLSDGEFVMDADTVSALGDGNNAAGASALEKMRQNIRKHKRSAPVNKIPPKAKKPEQYMKKGK